jgi:hypothetical protein
MAIDYFGTGNLYATPLYDGSGNAIAISSPVQFGIVQDITIEDSAENKELYGALQYPVDIGRGKSKLMIKVKQAFVNSELFNSVYFGQTLTSAYDALYADQNGTTLTAAINITPTAPFGGTSVFAADLGVADGNGVPYTRVASSPTSGQYSLSGSTYTFSALDVNKTAYISYQYSNATNPAAGKLLTVANLQMGQVPVFSAQFFIKRNGRTMWRKFPNCVATKLSMDFKNDDFVIPDMEISCFADSSNNIQYYSFTE